MNKNIKRFIEICKQPQMVLKNTLVEFLKANGYSPIVGDGYIYAPGVEPVCLTAHMDTVHEKKTGMVKNVVVKQGKISSPQGIGGDDRCGVYMIMNIVKQGIYPYILFCEDEEIGGIGSDKFVLKKEFDEMNEKIKFYIELDRANAKDLVFYDDVNDEFHEWCEKVTSYKEGYGSFSDISNLCPQAEISGVNISCGYYKAHTTDEYVVWEEMLNSIKATVKLIEAARELEKPWEYKEMPRKSWYVPYSKLANKWYMKRYIFIDYNGKIYNSDGETFEEAVANLVMDNPELCWGDIAEYYDENELYDEYFYDDISVGGEKYASKSV